MTNRERYNKVMEVVLLLSSILLILGVTVEVVAGDKSHFSTWFLTLQFTVCTIFLTSFFVGLAHSTTPRRYILRNLLFLLLSVPYLNIMIWFVPDIGRTTFIMAGITPVIRSLLALSIILRWTIRGSSAKRLFFAYTLAVLLFTHLSALLLFDIEYGPNVELKNFGDALWWAWMGLSTAGAQLAPITPIGRALGAILPIMGMMILPIFTGYILSVEKQRVVEGEPSKDGQKEKRE